jgi:hypothetical protein
MLPTYRRRPLPASGPSARQPRWTMSQVAGPARHRALPSLRHRSKSSRTSRTRSSSTRMRACRSIRVDGLAAKRGRASPRTPRKVCPGCQPSPQPCRQAADPVPALQASSRHRPLANRPSARRSSRPSRSHPPGRRLSAQRSTRLRRLRRARITPRPRSSVRVRLAPRARLRK